MLSKGDELMLWINEIADAVDDAISYYEDNEEAVNPEELQEEIVDRIQTVIEERAHLYNTESVVEVTAQMNDEHGEELNLSVTVTPEGNSVFLVSAKWDHTH